MKKRVLLAGLYHETNTFLRANRRIRRPIFPLDTGVEKQVRERDK